MRFQHNQLEAIMKFACEGSSVPFQNGLVFDGQSLIASDGLSIVKVTDPYSEPLGQQFLIPLDPVRLALTSTEDLEPIWIYAGELHFANMIIKYETRAGEIPDFEKENRGPKVIPISSSLFIRKDCLQPCTSAGLLTWSAMLTSLMIPPTRSFSCQVDTGSGTESK